MKIEYDEDNAAFDVAQDEHVSVLQDITIAIQRGATSGNIRDSNGNKIGTWERDK